MLAHDNDKKSLNKFNHLILECSSKVALLANLSDSSLTADSSHGGSVEEQRWHRPQRSRLHTPQTESGSGAWTSGSTTNAWIQADLMNNYYVSSVATHGRPLIDQWVTEYKLQYGMNENGLIYVENTTGATRIFTGNTDRNTVVLNTFDPVRTRVVRLNVVAFNSHVSMRWEVYGCVAGKLFPTKISNIAYAGLSEPLSFLN